MEKGKSYSKLQKKHRRRLFGHGWRKFRAKKACTPGSVTKAGNEVTQYFTMERISRHDNPLEWWRSHSEQFPQLVKVARHYLPPFLQHRLQAREFCQQMVM
ncbi:hypothetical protein PR048_011127 [Dryococelus australis]|uniref:HAT C-terminal dimerisation domain-containing protein n=1 Tax=Dryococelus australis TaxID=614101 RepID=A0ABQ9HLF7_9NEOP|nr:hypothetical protein PR048_011127 [Dryococelus australis]